MLDLDLSGSPIPGSARETLGRLVARPELLPTPAPPRRRHPGHGFPVGQHLRAALDAGPDLLNVEIAAGLPLFRSALRAADLRGLLASVAMIAAPAAAASAADLLQRIQPPGPVLSAASARHSSAKTFQCLEDRARRNPSAPSPWPPAAVPVLAACEAGT